MLKTEVLITFLFLTRLYEFFEVGVTNFLGGRQFTPTKYKIHANHRRQETACLAYLPESYVGESSVSQSLPPASPRDNMNKHNTVTSAGSLGLSWFNVPCVNSGL